MEDGLIRIESPPPQQQSYFFSSTSICAHISRLKTKACEAYRAKPPTHWALLSLGSAAMLVAFPASSLLSRLYFQNGGASKWIISWAAVAGWPIPALLLAPTYIACKARPTRLTCKLALSYVVLGLLSAADNLMFAYAYAYLPASTAALLASSSLVFSVFFGYVLAKNKVNAAVINSIVIITAAMVIIALDSDSDRYGNVSEKQYIMGFVWDILGSALHGLIFALSELVFIDILGKRSVHVVLEQQVAVSALAFLFTSVGVVVSKGGFGQMATEARGFKGGAAAYWQVVTWAAVTFQLGVLGATAALFLASTVLAGVLNAVRVPITAIAAVVLMNDPMSGFKILSIVVTFWGFGCYIYGTSSFGRNKSNSSTTTT